MLPEESKSVVLAWFCYHVLVVFGLATLWAWAQGAGVAGTYRCEGATDAGPYEHTLVVTTVGDGQRLVWRQIPPDIEVSRGIGFVRDDALVTAFVSASGIVGVASYAVTSGRLDGQWTAGDGVLYSELCVSGIPAAG